MKAAPSRERFSLRSGADHEDALVETRPRALGLDHCLHCSDRVGNLVGDDPACGLT